MNAQENAPIIDPTRWEGVSQADVFEWVAGTFANGQGRRTTESLHSTAASLAAGRDHLEEALRQAEAGLDEYTTASSGRAADAGARSIAGAVTWLRTLAQNATVVPDVMNSVAERFDQTRSIVDGAPLKPLPRYNSDLDNLQLSWMIPPPADQVDDDETRARRRVRDAMTGYQDEAITHLYRLPRFGPPPPALPPPVSPPRTSPSSIPWWTTQPERATTPVRPPRVESTVPIRRNALPPRGTPMAAVPMGFGPVGHEADDARFDAERTDRLPTDEHETLREHLSSAESSVMHSPSTPSLFESDEAVAPPVIGEQTEPHQDWPGRW
jgi:hypothetical protein